MISFSEEIDILRKEFDYLFDEGKFKIIDKKEFRRSHYFIGLESDLYTYRIKFLRELSPRWGMFIGTKTSQFQDGLKAWRPVEKVVNKLGVMIDFSALRELSYSEQVKQSLEILAKEIKPVFSKIRLE